MFDSQYAQGTRSSSGIRVSGTYPSWGAIVQYWRSFEHRRRMLAPKAKSIGLPGLNLTGGLERAGAVSASDETYVVKPGNYEAIHSGMPPCGLGKVGKLVPAIGALPGPAWPCLPVRSVQPVADPT